MRASERANDAQMTLQLAFAGMLQNVMTSYPVEILSFDEMTSTCSAKLLTLIKVQIPVSTPSKYTKAPGSTQKNRDNVIWEWKPPPLLKRCPIIFISGAGFTIVAPPRAGDEALAFFAQRSIDDWWQFGGARQRGDLRTHSISDGFILAGVRSRPKVIPNINPAVFEIRNDDGSVGMGFNSDAIEVTSPMLSTSGNLSVGSGASGTFTDQTGQTVTVIDGIITSIV